MIDAWNRTADSMILRWVKQHNVRVALSCSVFVLAVAELTLC